MTKSYTFNFHDDGTSEFLRYIWCTLMGGNDFQELMSATDKGHSITLSVMANGIEVNAQKMMKGLERNFDLSVQNELTRYIEEFQLSGLFDTVQQIEQSVKDTVKKKFKAAGIEINDNKDEW